MRARYAATSKRRRWAAGLAAVLALLAALAYGAGYRVHLIRVAGTPVGQTLDFASSRGDALPRFAGDSPASIGGEADTARVRNAILLIGDGLGATQVAAARAQIAGPGGFLSFERMPVTGWLAAHSASDLIPDSASAATALATGFKTENLRLSLSPSGRPLTTVLEAVLAQRGMVAGLVTSSYLVDATPAAFTAHVSHRSMGLEIARQMAASGVRILAGEASSRFDPRAGPAHRAAIDEFRRRGYSVVESWSELDASDRAAKVLALFPAGSVADPASSPELPQLARWAIDTLDAAAGPGGFFLLLEEEETDTGPHHRDFRRLVAGVRSLDAAAQAALEFAERDGGTLVVLTSDHETGGLAILSGRDGESMGVRWTTTHHTGAPVPLYAFGPGAERFAGVRDNTEVAWILAELLGADLEGGGRGVPAIGDTAPR